MSKLVVNYPDPGFWTKTSWIQIGYGVWVDLTGVAVGLAFGFSAVTMPQLTMPDSVLFVTQSQEAWIASAVNLASPVGCLGIGCIMDKFGRKIAIILSEIPMCAGWLYTGFAKTADDILIGRIITGIGVGMAVVPPRVYTTEISLPNMRGVIGAFPTLAIAIGIIIQGWLGSVINWRILNYIWSGFALFNFTIYLFLPETPFYLVMNDKIPEARKSLKKIRSSKFNVDAELNEIIDFKRENDICTLSTIGQIKALFGFAACKPFWIVIIYVLITQLSGVNIIIMWAVDILEFSNSTTNSYTGNVILGVTRAFFGLVLAILLYKCAKKHLAVASCVGVGLSCIAIFIHLNFESRNIFPMICWTSYIAFASIGHYTLPFLIMSELYPLQIRGLLSGISISLTNILMFLSVKYYPTVRDSLGFSYTILSFGLCSLLGCIVLFIILPETKDLTLQEIEGYFNRRRPTLTSQRALLSRHILQESNRNLSTFNMKDKSDKQLTKSKNSKQSSLKIANST